MNALVDGGLQPRDKVEADTVTSSKRPSPAHLPQARFC
jgi:hypothetical protein